MKLCNHRDPRNGVGSCGLRVCEVSGAKWDWRSLHVFVKEGHLPDNRNWYSHAFECTEKMAEACPYRVHTPIVKPPSKPKPEKCKRCGARHYSGTAQTFCDVRDEIEKQMQGWNPEGSRQPVYPESFGRYQLMNWPWVVGKIFERDNWKCQDCGLECSTFEWPDGKVYHNTCWEKVIGTTPEGYPDKELVGFEVHHIIPRGMGGSDHPANLKLVCQNCHKKYNEKFNGEIISRKARERKVKQLRLHRLDDF